jgi:YVTN family beta-propeller protein
MRKTLARRRCLLPAVLTLLAALAGARPDRAAEAGKYLGPSSVVAARDGARLFVAEWDARQVAVLDVAQGRVAARLPVPAEPSGMVLSPDGSKLYVTCAAPQSTVCVIDTASLRIVGSIPAGHTAMGPAVSPDGKRLYVCNRFDTDVSVIDLAAGRQIARVRAVREPYGAVVTADGKSVFVINHLPLDRADGYDVAARVTVIDTATNVGSTIRLLNGSTSVRGLCLSADGKHVYVTHVLARYQMPTTQLERGWMNTNALSIIDTAQKKLLNTVLLDDVDLGAANPWGVACTADGRLICVAHAGTHELSVIDAPALLEKLAKVPADAKAAASAAAQKDDRGIYASTTAADVPNDLAFLVDLRQRIELTGKGPRGVAIVGGKAYVTQYYSDTLAVVDLAAKADRPVSTIALGPEPNLSTQRRGEILFTDATICFQHWQSCGTCHPDSRVDALNWDLMNDGLGNPKNNKSMLLAHRTPPSMWSGVRPDAESAVRSGITHILFAVRPEAEAQAIDEFLKSLTPVPSPHLVHGQLSAAAQRGKALFHDEKIGCATCHPGPLYTDLKLHDVGSEGPYDRRTTFVTPTLVEVWRTAPYLHDGHYLSIKELLKEGNHSRNGGNAEGLSEQQLNDLVEFVLSL